eukprot:m.142868 g.142868  ORF g.142868 m.142868 type:complete len:62 (+) comp20416_c0_seq6:361-546(+)
MGCAVLGAAGRQARRGHLELACVQACWLARGACALKEMHLLPSRCVLSALPGLSEGCGGFP